MSVSREKERKGVNFVGWVGEDDLGGGEEEGP